MIVTRTATDWVRLGENRIAILAGSVEQVDNNIASSPLQTQHMPRLGWPITNRKGSDSWRLIESIVKAEFAEGVLNLFHLLG